MWSEHGSVTIRRGQNYEQMSQWEVKYPTVEGMWTNSALAYADREQIYTQDNVGSARDRERQWDGQGVMRCTKCAHCYKHSITEKMDFPCANEQDHLKTMCQMMPWWSWHPLLLMDPPFSSNPLPLPFPLFHFREWDERVAHLLPEATTSVGPRDSRPCMVTSLGGVTALGDAYRGGVTKLLAEIFYIFVFKNNII